MFRKATAEDRLVRRLVGKGGRTGSTLVGRVGDVVERPPLWGGVAGLISLLGHRGRRAAVRGGLCYVTASAVHLPIKALVGRKHPKGSALHQLGPFTSSFPSGHSAGDVAFVFGASQELPKLFVPLALVATAGHWALLRKKAHYPSDIVAGGFLGLGVALASRKIAAVSPGLPPLPPTRPSPGAAS